MVTVLYFASIKEKLGLAKEAVPLPPGVRHVGALAAVLRSRGDVWVDALGGGPSLKVAVNQSMATLDAVIEDGDEIAFFPPVTGG
ncbi:MAG: molybdopterin converting factor subunit 1 [Burkholderiales bacterium]|nr:molybdopterin converting factor subunit 1 [Burkholderiales bacterium]